MDAIATARTVPLGEIDPRVVGGTAHIHHCPACGRDYRHTERACLDGFERVAVGCGELRIAPARWRR